MPIELNAQTPGVAEDQLDPANSMGVVLVRAEADSTVSVHGKLIELNVPPKDGVRAGVSGGDALNPDADRERWALGGLWNQLVVRQNAKRLLFPEKGDTDLKPRLRPVPEEAFRPGDAARNRNRIQGPFVLVGRTGRRSSRPSHGSAGGLGLGDGEHGQRGEQDCDGLHLCDPQPGDGLFAGRRPAKHALASLPNAPDEAYTARLRFGATRASGGEGFNG